MGSHCPDHHWVPVVTYHDGKSRWEPRSCYYVPAVVLVQAVAVSEVDTRFSRACSLGIPSIRSQRPKEK